MIYALTEIYFDIQYNYIPSQGAICISGSPQGPLKYPLRGLGLPNNKNMYLLCPVIYALTGINFDIQHAYIPSQVEN